MSFSRSHRSFFKPLPVRVLPYLLLVLLNLVTTLTSTDAHPNLERCFDEFQALVLCQLKNSECLECVHPLSSMNNVKTCSDIDSLCKFGDCCDNCREEIQANIDCHYYDKCGKIICTIIDDVTHVVLFEEPVGYTPTSFPTVATITASPIVIPSTEAPVTGEPIAPAVMFRSEAPVVFVTEAPVTGEPISSAPSPITPAPETATVAPSELPATPVPYLFNATELLESARTDGPTIIDVEYLMSLMRTPTPTPPPTTLLEPAPAPGAAPEAFTFVKELLQSAPTPAPTAAPEAFIINVKELLEPAPTPAPTAASEEPFLDFEELLAADTRPQQRLIPGGKLSIFKVEGAQEKESSW